MIHKIDCVNAEEAIEITRRSYNDIARLYIERTRKPTLINFIQWTYVKYKANQLIRLLPQKKGKILLLGCADGRSAIHYAKKGYEVIGVDFSEEMIKIAEENKKRSGLENITFICSSIQNYDWKEEEHIAILADRVLYHTPPTGLEELLNKINKSLISQGVFFSNYKRGNGFSLKDYYIGKKDIGKEAPRANWYVEEEELITLFEATNFEAKIDPLIIPINNEHYLQVYAIKKAS